MSICCNFKISTVLARSYSLPIFIKHLTSTKTTTTFYNLSNKKTLTTCRSSISTNHIETLTSPQKEQISLYVDALLEWNQKMNLTAVTERNEVMDRHVEDSLAIIPPIQSFYLSHCNSSCDNLNLVDVGSGAGLPGLIFAIARPDWKVTLLESINKRCLFLEHAISVTGLSNVEVLRARAEYLDQAIQYRSTISGSLFSFILSYHISYLDIGQSAGHSPECREVFDVAVARAVAEMRVLAEYCLPLVRVGGLFVAAKGHDPQEEVKNAEKAIGMLGASMLQMLAVESHSPYGQRTAVFCSKDRLTPKKYPREPGTPAKEIASRFIEKKQRNAKPSWQLHYDKVL
ncbi:uncharacterized protein LOC113331514 isoform X1 [Papaver somniferum]|uniref:uncharacterized protein LOC113331514 isoform X1 n=1 Tax=Papaver somniferum TaxID=3469 RepID=UPI000E704D15|nr:uncharacterized protein LOC113331514 isoform X1 [Papaver somniferum]